MHNFLKITLPTATGLLLGIICLQLHQTFIDRFYDYDTVFSFEPLFDGYLYLVLYLPIWIIGILFQYFVMFRVWVDYNKKIKYFHLNLWQLTGLACLLFGIIMGLFDWNSQTGLPDLIYESLIWAGLAISYWIGNLFTMHLIDRLYLMKNK